MITKQLRVYETKEQFEKDIKELKKHGLWHAALALTCAYIDEGVKAE